MLRFAKLDRRVAAALVRVDEVDRVQLVAAVVALVASRVGVTADRALALDVPVRERAAAGGVERAHLLALDQVALLEEFHEQLLGDAVVVRRRGAREDVVGHAQPHQVIDDERAVAVHELARRDAFLVRFIGDRRPVLVGAARHQHTCPAQAPEPREHVARHGESDHVADVPRSVGIGPSWGDEDGSFRHQRSQG